MSSSTTRGADHSRHSGQPKRSRIHGAVIEILDPTVSFDEGDQAPTFSLTGGVSGKVVGLRLDHAWRSYHLVVDEWQALLEADGAKVRVVWPGERVGAEGERTRADLAEWSRLVDCGVVGLGN